MRPSTTAGGDPRTGRRRDSVDGGRVNLVPNLLLIWYRQVVIHEPADGEILWTEDIGARYVLRMLFMCPHTTTYVSSYVDGGRQQQAYAVCVT